RVLGVFLKARISEEEAANAFLQLTSYTIGYVAIETGARRPADPNWIADRLSEAFAEGLPHVTAAAPSLAGFLVQGCFAEGLERILRAVAIDVPKAAGR
ncbi:MAG: hypothetical protein ACYS22_07430, partial [Planctomycetota bacterium]